MCTDAPQPDVIRGHYIQNFEEKINLNHFEKMKRCEYFPDALYICEQLLLHVSVLILLLSIVVQVDKLESECSRAHLELQDCKDQNELLEFRILELEVSHEEFFYEVFVKDKSL